MSRLVTGVSAAPGKGVDGTGSRGGVGAGEAVGEGAADGVECAMGDGGDGGGVGVGVSVGVEETVGLPWLQAAIRRTMATVPMVPTTGRPGRGVAPPRMCKP